MKIKITTGLILAILFLSMFILTGFSILMSNLIKKADTKWAIIVFALIIISSFIYDTLNKRKNLEKKMKLLKVGEQILANHTEEFAGFYNLYFNDKKKFLSQNVKLLKGAEALDLKNLKPMELIYIFANSKNLIQLIDWRGEENNNEIEAFIDKLLKQNPPWVNTSKLRSTLNKNNQRENKFIIDLFKAVDKDLCTISHRLIFFQLGWDAHVYTVISSNVFDEIKNNSSNDFYGVDKMKA